MSILQSRAQCRACPGASLARWWLVSAALAIGTACGSSDPDSSPQGAGGTTPGASGSATSGTGGTTAAGAGGTATAGTGGTSAAGTAGTTSAGTGGTTSAGTGGAAGSGAAGVAGSATVVCPGSYFCDDFEDVARSTDAWKPVNSGEFTYPTFVTSPTAHGGLRVMHAEATKPPGGANLYNLAFHAIGTVDTRPASVSFAFRLVQGDSLQQLLQFDAFDDATTNSGFELQLQVDAGTVKMNVVDFNPASKPGGYATVNLGTAPVGAWTTVSLLLDVVGPTPGVRGSINGGPPSVVLPFVPTSTSDSTKYRLEMTLGTFSILGGTNAVDLDDVDVRPR